MKILNLKNFYCRSKRLHILIYLKIKMINHITLVTHFWNIFNFWGGLIALT
ncbi:MAG: hypothetical protein PWR20_1954 [Bacteroidales bacterium]|jgi:hypothetical protein|nr:hypothetical protein [Bacteroidales bacterium]MDN5330473.1 hypothetical protein [Bacteroidales bacterium]